MALKIYNDLTRKFDEFSPLNPDKVSMYVCGITPYDETHLGHARAYITFDIVRRYFEFLNYEVKHVQNFTDVDDKIIKKSEIRNPKSETNSKSELQNPKQKCREVSEKYIASYFEVMDKLNIKRANIYPKATEHIPEMVSWIKGLIDRGFAYLLDDGVYFEVSKFKDYGKLSGRKLDEMESGARVDVNQKKRNPLDFALWKLVKEGEPSWESPWGAGRPGWHIECSAMSTKYLGEQFDIHGGGLDLEFPHHENEIAQTEALTNKVPWVKYWMHNGFVNINSQKMSKSLGNFFTLTDIFIKYDPMIVRLFLLMTHYRSPINFSDEQLNEAKTAYSKIVNIVYEIDFLISKVREPEAEIEVLETDDELARFKNEFVSAMDDDFNTAKAIGIVFEFIGFVNKHIKREKIDTGSLKEYKKLIFELCGILGLKIEDRESSIKNQASSIDNPDIEKLISERNEARASKNFKRADEMRKQLLGSGIILEDTAYGTKWSKS
ncbi:cysteine--tRNA ligase [Candidatus Saganbacteria bacterium]|nr:cysteine--tRNA ligase [Candidatus Saganbacteria bacterium]